MKIKLLTTFDVVLIFLASCIECGASADGDSVKNTIVEKGIVPKCESCGGNVKPDIVFFGEQLVRRVHNSTLEISGHWCSKHIIHDHVAFSPPASTSS